MQNFHLFMSIMGNMFGFMGKFFKEKKKNIFLLGEIYIDAYGRYSCSILTHNLFYGYFVV